MSEAAQLQVLNRISKEGFPDRPAKVIIEPAETHAQGAGKGGLRITGVRRRLQMGIAEYHVDRVAPSQANERRAQNDQARRDSGGNIVRDIVEPRGRPTESNVSI